MKKLAIIGAAPGQKALCEKAKEMGLYTIGFAWEKNAVCKDLFSRFYPISITEYRKITEICKQEQIDGVVSNASDLTAKTVSYIATALSLPGNPYNLFEKAFNKFFVRERTSKLEELSPVKAKLINKGQTDFFYPAVIKPCTGCGKKGVHIVRSGQELAEALEYAQKESGTLMIEELISGREISAESLSFGGQHQVIQLTDKEIAGAPHFVETGHRQPATLSEEIKEKINRVVPRILDAVGFTDGAAHTELKIDEKSRRIYLIEVNLRGGGDEISNSLVRLSTGFDYVRAMIEIALGEFRFPSEITDKNIAGILYLCKQTKEKFKNFDTTNFDILQKHIPHTQLTESTGNYNRDGYIIYCGKEK